MRRKCAIFMLACTFVALAVTHALAGDAISYCAKVGNDDKIRKITPDLMPFAKKEFSGWDIADSTFYRCMSGKVWICSIGANLPCWGVDRRKRSPEIDAYCHENPNEDFIPMAVTGHATIYSWKCIGGKPVITGTETLDARGFQSSIWHRVK